MVDKLVAHDAELVCIIVNNGLAGKICHRSKELGVLGGTVALGMGTSTGKFLDMLTLRDVRKEVIFMIAKREVAHAALDQIHKEHDFNKPNHGIAFTSTVMGAVGSKWYKELEMDDEKGDDVMHHIITVIVEKGKGEDAVEAATNAGSNGGTIINARGAGVHETQKVFGIDIEPEKEIVLIISAKEQTEDIITGIREKLDMEKPGHGIIYVQNVNKVYGF